MVRSLNLIHSTLSAYMKMNSLRFEDLTLKCKDVARKKQELTVLIFIWVKQKMWVFLHKISVPRTERLKF